MGVGGSIQFSFPTAVSATDYVSQTTILNFKPCNSVKCVDVTLKDDCEVEKIESFDILITTPSYVDERIIIESGTGRIFIVDDDSMK